MNTLLLEPSDVLFFRDGRPMSGSLSGHGAAWPLPTVVNAALHAALHRIGFSDDEIHRHRAGRSGIADGSERIRKFGSLITAGPFPVSPDGKWLFPRPLDANAKGSTVLTQLPHKIQPPSSLPGFLSVAAASVVGPSKDVVPSWWDAEAWNSYLQSAPISTEFHAWADADFSDTEHAIGIGIDPETGTQDQIQFYSAHYLRLQPNWRIGVLASAMDKIPNRSEGRVDLIERLFPNSGCRTPVVVGGQQRLCSVERSNPTVLPLPTGCEVVGEFVKWTLLSPAVWPEIPKGSTSDGRAIHAHPGGWLPNWVDATSGKVLLKLRSGTVSRDYSGSRVRRVATDESDIDAHLVGAITGKPIPVSGYALHGSEDPGRSAHKSTHLAVPSGSVFYFQANGDSPEARLANARKLATALNWHGDSSGTSLKHRRSTLFGEKGFGLGVCSNWFPHVNGRPQSATHHTNPASSQS